MRNILRLKIIIAIFILTASRLLGQISETRIDSLTLDQAVSLALQHNPSLRAADAGVLSASSGLTQADAAYFPSIAATASASRTGGAFVLNPSVSSRNQTYNTYTTGFQVNQTIFDFGKTIGRVSGAGSFLDAAESDLISARENVVMNTSLAYFGYVQAIQVEKVNEEAAQRASQHLNEAKAFYTVGKRAQFDVTRAEVDLANANVNLIRSRNQIRLAKLQLENAMGIHPSSDYRVTEAFPIPEFSLPLDSVKLLTFGQRPELIAATARLEANKSLVSAAWDQHLPTLSASGAWTWSNFDFPLFSRWNVGLTMSLPIFQGFSISAQVEQARAAADAAQANLDVLRESVILEVEQNYLGLKEAEERIAASTKLVEQAEQNLNLAERQYAAGVGTALEVADAQLTLSNARITRIQALYDYNSSLRKLERSMGILTG